MAAKYTDSELREIFNDSDSAESESSASECDNSDTDSDSFVDSEPGNYFVEFDSEPHQNDKQSETDATRAVCFDDAAGGDAQQTRGSVAVLRANRGRHSRSAVIRDAAPFPAAVILATKPQQQQ